MTKKEFYLPNKNKLNLYSISYLEDDFTLITDEISYKLGNTKLDLPSRLMPKGIENKRKIILKNNMESIDRKVVFPIIYRYYLEEDPFIKSLVSIDKGLEEISFKEIDSFLEENKDSKYLIYLKEYLQIFDFEYLESFSLEDILKKELKELEKTRDFYKVERYLDQKYFLEVAINSEYRRKEERAIANRKVLTLGDRVIE